MAAVYRKCHNVVTAKCLVPSTDAYDIMQIMTLYKV